MLPALTSVGAWTSCAITGRAAQQTTATISTKIFTIWKKTSVPHDTWRMKRMQELVVSLSHPAGRPAFSSHLNLCGRFLVHWWVVAGPVIVGCFIHCGEDVSV